MSEPAKPMTDEWFREIGAAAGKQMGAALRRANEDARIAGERIGKAIAALRAKGGQR